MFALVTSHVFDNGYNGTNPLNQPESSTTDRMTDIIYVKPGLLGSPPKRHE